MQAAKKKRAPLIKTRLRRIVLAPVSALVVLWLIGSVYLAYGTVVQYAYVQANDRLLLPSALALTAVMDERSVTMAYLDRPRETRETLLDVRADVDQRMGNILDEFRSLLSLSPEKVQKRITYLDEKFKEIGELRARVDQGNIDREEVEEYYNDLVMAGADLFDEQARSVPSPEVVGPSVSAVSMFRVVDALARADAKLSRGFATGEFSMDDQHEFVAQVGAYESMLEAVDDYLGPEPTNMLASLRDNEEYVHLHELIHEIANRMITTEFDPYTGQEVEDLSLPVDEAEWRSAYLPVKDALTEIGASQATWGAQVQRSDANQSLLIAVLGSLGVAALTATVLVYSTRSSQRLVDRLVQLRDQTQELADKRLPALMDRLKKNEPLDSEVEVEAEILPLSESEDEIGEVSRAFTAAQRTAVEAAVRQAQLRQGVNRVFLNIAHRSQTLVHRQLRILDKLEREQEDPEQLTDLFKLDHLATRARRNAENLLILGGQNPGRTWHHPLPLIDVLRGAISECGDYSRVKRQRIAPVSVQGNAVADVIHLVAELVDNATTFSPPHTKVHLRADRVPNGVTIEIEDRGLGMKDDELESANAMLADPPEFDVMRLNEKTRLGLFVVSHLARRHHIKVQLRTSPYGGVLAIVLLPANLIVDEQPSPLRGANTDGGETGSGLPQRGVRTPALPAASPTGAPSEEASESDGDMLTTPSSSQAPAQPPRLPRRIPGVSTFPELATEGAARRPTPPAPSGSSPADAPQRPQPAATEGRPPLPRRIPQVNLVPQLCDDPTEETASSPETGPSTNDMERPTRLRQTLTAFQQGTRKGREDGKKLLNDTEKDAQ